jgi:hypothetical protein
VSALSRASVPCPCDRGCALGAYSGGRQKCTDASGLLVRTAAGGRRSARRTAPRAEKQEPLNAVPIAETRPLWNDLGSVRAVRGEYRNHVEAGLSTEDARALLLANLRVARCWRTSAAMAGVRLPRCPSAVDSGGRVSKHSGMGPQLLARRQSPLNLQAIRGAGCDCSYARFARARRRPDRRTSPDLVRCSHATKPINAGVSGDKH